LTTSRKSRVTPSQISRWATWSGIQSAPRTSSGEAYVSEARGALALIGVVDQARPRPAACEGHLQRVDDSSARMWLAIDALNLRRDGRPKSVHEADDHRALADRGGAALDGSGTDVAGEGCEVERPHGRGRRVTAKPGCDDVPSAAAELGKEGRRGRRMVREAVQDERRLTNAITTLQGVKGAVWQVEGDVFELHVRQSSPRAVGREMLMLASVSLIWDMCLS
jgi:hypothetical protein